MKMDVENDQYWKKKLLRHFNNDTGYKDPFIEEKHVKVKEKRNEYGTEDGENFEFDENENLQWDDAGHMMWYDDLDELLSQAQDSMVKGEATYECLSLYDANMESKLSTANVTAEPDPVLTVPFRDSLPDDVDRDNMELLQLQMQLPLPKLNYNLDPTHVTASDLVKVSVSKCVSLPMVTSFVSASTLLGTEMPVSTYPFVTAATVPTVAIFLLVNCEVSIAVTEIVLWNKMESLVMVIKSVTLSLVALFLAATAMLGTRYYAVYQTSTTAMLLYELDPLWLDLVALAYTLDHCTAALKLLLDGPKLALYSIKVTDFAKAHLALLIGSTYTYNRYKFNVRSLVSANLSLLRMLYVANVMHGRTLFMSQHMLLTHLFAMAASFGVFLLVYNKLILTTSGEYLKLLASAYFTLQVTLYTVIMVSFTVLPLPLFRLDTNAVLKDHYDLSTALMHATDTIIAPYHVDWGARNLYFENLALVTSLYLTPARMYEPKLNMVTSSVCKLPQISDPRYFANNWDQADMMRLPASYFKVTLLQLHGNLAHLLFITALYLFNEDYADVTVPLPLQDSCLLPSSDIVSEAELLVEMEPGSCQLLPVFLASVPLTNRLYFVDEAQADLPPLHLGYTVFVLLTNALYLAYCTTQITAISKLAQVTSKLPSPLHNLNMDKWFEASQGYFMCQTHNFLALLLYEVDLFVHYFLRLLQLLRSDQHTLVRQDRAKLSSLSLSADLDPWRKANWDAPLHSAEHTASKLLGPDLGTFADRVQMDINVMLLPASPYVDVSSCASHRYYKGSLGQ